MTATKHVTLLCDIEGCHKFSEIGEAHTVVHARQVARIQGWRTSGPGGPIKDICPRHDQIEESER